MVLTMPGLLCHALVVTLVLLGVLGPSVTAFTTVLSGRRRPGTGARPTIRSTTTTALSDSIESPVLVVGATGRVGRRVVQQLLGKDVAVRALVRDPAKAQRLFGTSTSLQYPKLDIVVADVARYEQYEDVLDKAVEGCSAVISVLGAVRFAKPADFWPWRLFRIDPSRWAGRDHPWYGNYLGQKKLIELAEKHNIRRFVRLTGLGLAYSAFNPFAILFNTLLSLNNRYGILCEQALAKSTVPYVVVRPGGLAQYARNVTSTNLQVDPSGKLPFPARVGRSDVAALCISSTDPNILPSDKSYTLACRWVGEDVKPKPQGIKDDGFETAEECLRNVARQSKDVTAVEPRMKPYAVPVAMVVYSFVALSLRVLLAFWSLTKRLVLQPE